MIPEGDMSGLLAQAQAMQQQLFQAQQELAETESRVRPAVTWSPPPSPGPASSSGWSSSPRPSIPRTPRPWPTWSWPPCATPTTRPRPWPPSKLGPLAGGLGGGLPGLPF